MGSMMQTVGFLAVGAIILAIIGLAVVSWLKNRRHPGTRGDDNGGSDATTDPTPGHWE